MAQVPEDYTSGPDEDEKPKPQTQKKPRSRKLSGRAKPSPEAAADPEPPGKMEPQPQQPEETTEKEDFEEVKPEHAENVMLQPTEMSEDIPTEAAAELSQPELQAELSQPELQAELSQPELQAQLSQPELQAELSQPELQAELSQPELQAELSQLELQGWASETSEVMGLPDEDLEGSGEETYEEPGPELSENDYLPLTRDVSAEQAAYVQPSTETMSGAASSQTRLELPEQTEPENSKQLFPEFYEETESQEQSMSVKSDEEVNQMATAEMMEETQREWTEEKSAKPSEMNKPEFPDQETRQPFEEAHVKSPEDTTPEVLEKMQVSSTEALKTESVEKRPEKKTKKSVGRTRLQTSGKKTPGETDLELLVEIQSYLQEETPKKSIEEKVPEPLGDSKTAGRKEKPKKSSKKQELVRPEKYKAGEMGDSTELPEPSYLEIPNKKLRKQTGTQVSPKMSKPEVQEKSQISPTMEKNLELPDEPKLKERHPESSKEGKQEPSKHRFSIDRQELVQLEYQTRRLSVKETDTSLDIARSPKESEVDSVTTDSVPGDLVKKQPPVNISVQKGQLLELPMELKESFDEDAVDLSQELEIPVPKDKQPKPKRIVNLQFEHLKWSPEKVAEWISELGFPQYKECFTSNFINGRKLIHVNCSNLPQMGITDFEDMKAISQHTRDLLGIEEPLFSRSISLPYRDNIGLFLEQKGHSGAKSDSLTLPGFIEASGLQDYGPEIIASEEDEVVLEESHFS